MRWFKRSTDSPKLLSLSPLRHSELGNAYSGGGSGPSGAGSVPEEAHEESSADGDTTEQPSVPSSDGDPPMALPGPLMDLYASSACSSSSGSTTYTASCSSPSATSSPSTSTTFSYTSDSSSLCNGMRAQQQQQQHQARLATSSSGGGGGCGANNVNGSAPRKSRIGKFELLHDPRH